VEVPTIVLMQARTLVQLGRWVEGADKYASVQRWRDARPAEQANPTFVQAAEAAAVELAHLMPRIPKLNVQVSGAREGEAVEVYLDNRRMLDALVGADVPVDPGTHSVEVRRPDGRTVSRQLSIPEGRREEVTILLEAEQPPAPKPVEAPVAASAPVERDGAGGSSRATFGWLLLGTGAVAAGIGTVTGIVALGKKADLDEVCDPGCDVSHEETLDSYRLNRTLSYVGFAIGVAGVSSGAYLLLSGSEEKPELALGVEPGGARLWGTF
jgi:hypothetical protein